MWTARKHIVTLNVIYYMPDYEHLLQEFIWTCEDSLPELKRTHGFLLHWKQNIDAVIKEVLMGVDHVQYARFRHVDEIFRSH